MYLNLYFWVSRWLVSVTGGCLAWEVCSSGEEADAGLRDGLVRCTVFWHQPIAFSDSYTRA